MVFAKFAFLNWRNDWMLTRSIARVASKSHKCLTSKEKTHRAIKEAVQMGDIQKVMAGYRSEFRQDARQGKFLTVIPKRELVVVRRDIQNIEKEEQALKDLAVKNPSVAKQVVSIFKELEEAHQLELQAVTKMRTEQRLLFHYTEGTFNDMLRYLSTITDKGLTRSIKRLAKWDQKALEKEENKLSKSILNHISALKKKADEKTLSKLKDEVHKLKSTVADEVKIAVEIQHDVAIVFMTLLEELLKGIPKEFAAIAKQGFPHSELQQLQKEDQELVQTLVQGLHTLYQHARYLRRETASGKGDAKVSQLKIKQSARRAA